MSQSLHIRGRHGKTLRNLFPVSFFTGVRRLFSSRCFVRPTLPEDLIVTHALRILTLLSGLAVVFLPGSVRADEVVTPINDRDYYPAVLKLINEAEHSIRACLYQVTWYEEYPGSSSNNLVDALANAARRGVEVVAVIDRSSFRGDHDEKNQFVAEKLAEAGVSVYLDPDEVQSHQKLLIVDRDVVVVASINWSYYSLDKNREVATILWSPEAGRRYEHYFARRLADAEPFATDRVVYNELAESILDDRNELGFTGWASEDVEYLENRWFYHRLVPSLRAAETSIDVVQSYANSYGDSHPRAGNIPGRPAAKPPETDLLADELIAAAARGVKVRVLMDYTADGDFVREWKGGTLRMAEKLEEGGVEVYKDDPSEQIHAKMLMIDSEEVVIGSTNWSFEALEMNNEVSVLIDAPVMVEEVYVPWVTDLFERAAKWDEDVNGAN